ncbi:hypothetical protein S40285_09861 [Stachybotrys chlorohalonatus IBT 40285]|uniref:Uncharacterized protein n=1 Tax=Stachybotrys chlorohalonatus (strain IBT 40285) TaxID=1283841 RepID=A0A084QRI3_STAC4|nr:hypothetical protein S40285_09861 [Stachybotrys chlorohalonata IBT 40285]
MSWARQTYEDRILKSRIVTSLLAGHQIMVADTYRTGEEQGGGPMGSPGVTADPGKVTVVAKNLDTNFGSVPLRDVIEDPVPSTANGEGAKANPPDRGPITKGTRDGATCKSRRPCQYIADGRCLWHHEENFAVQPHEF